jgi:hypothetical protein
VKIKALTGAVLAGGIAVSAFALTVPSANADLNATEGGNQVVVCTGGEYIASLNPTIKDGDAVNGFAARYVKAGVKLSDGTKTLFGNPLPADNTACAIDAGIRTDQANQDIKYLLDNQTGSQNNLTLLKMAGVLVGSTQCASAAPETGQNAYPTAYPLQGKLTYGFDQLLNGKPFSMQAYVRTYSDDADPGVFLVTGTLIKGPGLGGRVTTAFSFLPTDSTKNINVVAGCPDGTPGNAAGAELWVTGADSAADVDVLNQPMTVTLSDDFSSEQMGPNAP